MRECPADTGKREYRMSARCMPEEQKVGNGGSCLVKYLYLIIYLFFFPDMKKAWEGGGSCINANTYAFI